MQDYDMFEMGSRVNGYNDNVHSGYRDYGRLRVYYCHYRVTFVYFDGVMLYPWVV